MKTVSPAVLGPVGLLDGHLGPLGLGGAFEPLSLGPVLWLKADAGTYQSAGGSAATADGDLVGEWQDQSGNARHVVQSTAGRRPQLKLNIKNGKPVVRFDGSDDYLLATLGSAPITDGTLTAYVVYQRRFIVTDASPLNCYLNTRSDDYATVDSFVFGYEAGGSAVSTYRAAGLSTASHPGNGAWMVAGTNFSGTHNTLRVNAVAQSSVVTSGNFGFNRVLLGARYYTSIFRQFGAYDIGEMLLLPGSLTAGETSSIEAYLNSRWGVY